MRSFLPSHILSHMRLSSAIIGLCCPQTYFSADQCQLMVPLSHEYALPHLHSCPVTLACIIPDCIHSTYHRLCWRRRSFRIPSFTLCFTPMHKDHSILLGFHGLECRISTSSQHGQLVGTLTSVIHESILAASMQCPQHKSIRIPLVRVHSVCAQTGNAQLGHASWG